MALVTVAATDLQGAQHQAAANVHHDGGLESSRGLQGSAGFVEFRMVYVMVNMMFNMIVNMIDYAGLCD